MKATALGLLLLAATASAQVLRPVDPSKLAEASGKKADVQTLKLDTLDQPTRAESTAPQSDKTPNMPAWNGSRAADISGSLPLEMYPTTTIPHQNFTAKRAVLPDKAPSTKPIKSEPANINKRVIKPFTPAGAEELKQQLNTPH
jgi:hypothetical protein